MTYKEPNGKWFKEYKKTIAEFKHKDNAIESLKWRYEKETRLLEWIMGIAIVLLLSLSISEILKSQNRGLVIAGVIAYIFCLFAITISIILEIFIVSRQRKIMLFLYREKDKE